MVPFVYPYHAHHSVYDGGEISSSAYASLGDLAAAMSFACLPYVLILTIVLGYRFFDPENVAGTLVSKNGTEFVIKDFHGNYFMVSADTAERVNSAYLTLQNAKLNDTLEIDCRYKEFKRRDAVYKMRMQTGTHWCRKHQRFENGTSYETREYGYTPRIRNLSVRNTKHR